MDDGRRLCSLVFSVILVLSTTASVAGQQNHSHVVTRDVKPTGWKLSEYPNPRINPSACGRMNISFVCDPDQVLSTEEGYKLDRLLMSTCSDTRCPCGSGCGSGCDGYSIAVAIVNKFYRKQGDYRKDVSEAKKWADNLRKYRWKYGKCGEDMVIALSKLDRKVYISTGMKTRLILTDTCVQNVYEHIKNNLTEGRLMHGLIDMIYKFRSNLNDASCKTRQLGRLWVIIPIFLSLGVALCITGGVIYKCFIAEDTSRRPYTSKELRKMSKQVRKRGFPNMYLPPPPKNTATKLALSKSSTSARSQSAGYAGFTTATSTTSRCDGDGGGGGGGGSSCGGSGGCGGGGGGDF